MPGRPPSVPVGFRFLPTDQELLGYFLLNKYLTRSSSPAADCLSVITECDLYGPQEPWEIWETYKGKNSSLDGQDLFFFTKLTKKFNRGSRNRRTIGSGAWEGETSGKKGPVMDPTTNTLLGWKKRFRYENKKTEMKHQHGGWIMLEYNLNPDLLPPKHKQSFVDDYVICRIRKNETEKRICMKRKKEYSMAAEPLVTGETKSFKAEDLSTVLALPATSQLISSSAHRDPDHDHQPPKKSKPELSSNYQAGGNVDANSNYSEWAEWFSQELKLLGNEIQKEESNDEIVMLSNYELFSWQY